jgi:ATP-dependent helicase/nuclease subunit A
MANLTELLREPSAALLEDMRTVYPRYAAYSRWFQIFPTPMPPKKNRRGLMDFSDREHHAVALLTGEAGEPTELARQWGGRYAEIMVDEFQDTNEVQNTIFSALSRGGRNLFLVGDVKQSIYRFRLADPNIFIRKMNAFKRFDEAAQGEERYNHLSRNFRLPARGGG